jgi:L-fuculose-phosphate aldolase
MEMGMKTGRPPSRNHVRWFIEIGQRLDRKGFIASNDGNLSCVDDDGSLLVTATGARKGYLREDQIVRVDRAGRLLHGAYFPSSELEMHLAVYAERPDVRAVVHAHPPHATAFAVARQPLAECVLPEVILTLGSVPIAPYATPGTGELGESVRDLVRRHDALLLANHGALTVGDDLESAYFVMERLEHSATILFFAQMLGQVTRLDPQQVARLMDTGPPEVRGTVPCVPEPAVRGGASAHSPEMSSQQPLRPESLRATQQPVRPESLGAAQQTVSAEAIRAAVEEVLRSRYSAG